MRPQPASWSAARGNQQWQQGGQKPTSAGWNQGAQRTISAPASAAAKRPEPTPTGAVRRPAPAGETPSLTVSSSSKRTDIGIPTLCGDYVEKGMNHSKKYYQKLQKIAGHEEVKVFLYFWDNRDGPDFSGWWFGDQLGGSQVWARCATQTPQPPRAGWKLPWDAPKAEVGLLFVDPYKPGAASSAGSSSAPAVGGSIAVKQQPGTAAQSGGGSKTAKQVEAAEKEAADVLTEVKQKLAQTPLTESTLKEVQETCQKQQASLNEVQKLITQEVNNARALGPSGQSITAELSKLSPKLRQIQVQITTHLNSARTKLASLTKAAADTAKKAEQDAATKKREEESQAELKTQLAQSNEVVNLAEDGVEACSILAQPFLENPAEAQGLDFDKACEEIEKQAADAFTKISEARKDLGQKITSARSFPPETRKQAVEEFTKLQGKVSEAQRKLNPFKAFKKEIAQRVEAKKALDEILDKLSAAEVEVEKVALMTAPGETGQLPEAEIAAAEEAVKPAQMGLQGAIKVIEQKARGSTGTVKEDLNKLKDKAMESSKKLEACKAVLKKNKEGVATTSMLATAKEKVDKIDEGLAKCSEAEMPFLKGIEVLPADESAKAIADLESAATLCQNAVNQAKTFLLLKMSEAKKYTSKELSQEVLEKLQELSTRMDEGQQRLQNFKKETSDRKVAAVMAEVVEGVNIAEQKVKELTESATIFSSESLEDVSVDALKEAIQKTQGMSKEVEEALTKARSVVDQKRKEHKTGETATALSKFQTRLSQAVADRLKSVKAAANGEKIVRDKQVLAEEETNLKTAEEQTEKAAKLSAPADGASLTDEAIKEMDELTVNAVKLLKQTSRIAESKLPTAAAAMKASFQKLVDRSKKAQETVDKIKKDTKDQREKVLSEVYIQEAEKKVQELESALEKVNEVELPFLKGIEVLPLKEAQDTIVQSEAAAATVQSCINQARTYIASKSLEVKNFDKALADPTKEKLSSFTERIQAGTAKLSTFRKDTESRKRTAQLQQAGEMLTAVEEEVKKVSEAVQPFVEKDLDSMSQEAADEACKEFFELQQGAQGKVEEARTFLAERSRDSKNAQEQKETLAQLQSRLGTAKGELDKAKKAAAEREQKYTAKKVLAEVQATIAKVEAEVKGSQEKCAPLIEEGGERFLVAASIGILASVLKEHMQEKERVVEDLFNELNNGKPVEKESFKQYLEKLPESISRDEVSFPVERCAAIAEAADADKDGSIGLADFSGLFQQRFQCVQKVTVTDGFKVADSKTVAKLEGNELLEAVGVPKKDEATGIVRLECKILSSGESGWVTVTGNSGTKYLEAISPLTDFLKEAEASIAASADAAKKASSFLTSKIVELPNVPSNVATKELRQELMKLKPQIASLSSACTQLTSKLSAGKLAYEKKAEKEKNHHIEVREKKAAEAVMAPAKEAVANLEELKKKLEETSAPIVSATGDSLLDLATPLSVSEACESLLKQLQEATAETKTKIKEGQSQLTNKGAMLEARRELGKMQVRVEGFSRAGTLMKKNVLSKCDEIAEAKYQQACTAFKKEMQAKGVDSDAYFKEMSGGEERITEEKFVQKLEKFGMKTEQAKLLTRKLEVGGIGRRKFMSLVEQYYGVVKDIAITTAFQVDKCKTLRKLEAGEVIEVLEGPATEEKTNLQRIRGRSLRDFVEGWVSLKGNQGSKYLQEVDKPHYALTEKVKLETAFSGESVETIRMLDVYEVLELLEGPKKETYSDAIRVRGKTTDGRTGWITCTDHNGQVIAEKAKKYFKCVAPVAITDDAKIRDCKVLRKLSVGEVFIADEEPQNDEDAGILRVKGSALKDGQAGWVTVKGNAGTVYAEPSQKHWTILKEAPLQTAFPSSSESQGEPLKANEAFEVLEGPRSETFAPVERVKGRALKDGKIGWITLTNSTAKAWSPYYKCLAAVPILADRAKDAAVVRQLEQNEIVEYLEGPELDAEGEETAGAVLIKARASKDGVSGWIKVREAKKVYLASQV